MKRLTAQETWDLLALSEEEKEDFFTKYDDKVDIYLSKETFPLYLVYAEIVDQDNIDIGCVVMKTKFSNWERNNYIPVEAMPYLLESIKYNWTRLWITKEPTKN